MTNLNTMKKMKAWQRQAELNAPKPGDLAPDFELPELDGTSTIRLSEFRGKKPVALIFGSFT